MKHYLMLSLLCLLAGGANVDAQLRLGVKGGVDMLNASLKGNVTDNLRNSNFGNFYIGPVLELNLPGRILALEVGALYVQSRIEHPLEEYRNEVYEHNQLEVPLAVKLRLPLLGPLSVYGLAGPYGRMKLANAHYEELSFDAFASGVYLGAGVELIEHLQVGVNCRLALADGYSIIDGNLTEHLQAPDAASWSLVAAFFF
jgi:hypothetical protein